MTFTPRLTHHALQSPVRNQGPRGTCAVFAATGAHEWLRADELDLSEEANLWGAKQLSPTPGEATSAGIALSALVGPGQTTEEAWPYGYPAFPASPPEAATNGAWYTSGSSTNHGHPDFAEIEALLRAATPLVLTVDFVRDAWWTAQSTGFVDAPPGEVVVDGHAVVAVAIGDFDGSDVVAFKNSWGASWGDRGYGYLSAGYWTRYGRRLFTLR